MLVLACQLYAVYLVGVTQSRSTSSVMVTITLHSPLWLSLHHAPPRHPGYTTSCLDLQSLRHPSKDKYSAITAYGTSKLCNLLFAQQFHRNNVEHGVYCNAVHPGNLLPTNLTRDSGLMYKAAFTLARPFTKSVVCALSIAYR